VLLLLLVGMSYAKLELGESVEVEGGAKGGVHLPAARCHRCKNVFLHDDSLFCRKCGAPRPEDDDDMFDRLFASDVEERVYPAGAQVMVRGEKGTEMLLVVRGRLAVYMDLADKVPVTELTQGQVCGEGALVEKDSVRTANVVAKEETTALVLPSQAVEQLEELCPGLSVALKALFDRREGGQHDDFMDDDTHDSSAVNLLRTLSSKALDSHRHSHKTTSARGMANVSMAASKFKRVLVERRHRLRMDEFKKQRKQWRQWRQDGVMWTITSLTTITCLVMGGCLSYVALFRVDWWGRGCLEGEIRARETGSLRDADEALLCHTDVATLDMQMWLVLSSCLMEVIANVMYVVVVDVDLNEWFDQHPRAFSVLAWAQAARAIGHALFFPECWLVLLALAMARSLRRGDNKLAKTDQLMIMMIVWPWAFGLQITGWLSHYIRQDWPFTSTELTHLNQTDSCTIVSIDNYGYINLYLKRLLALFIGMPLFIGSLHLLHTGFIDDDPGRQDISVSRAFRSAAFKRVNRHQWSYMAYFWFVSGALRIDGVIEWHPSESESRLFENTRYHSTQSVLTGVAVETGGDVLRHGGQEVLFDLSMGGCCLIPPLVIYLFKDRIWSWLSTLFDQRQQLQDGAFIAAMFDVDEDSDGRTEAMLVKLARKRLRRVKWSKIRDDPGVLSRRSSSDYELSEPCEPGTIDFFVSHSHKDDPNAKFRELHALAERFEEQHGREPTFWLDKVCIDTRDLSEQLKCLPLFVMACSKFLILHSPTYVKRLWCIWELYTCFAMEVPTRRIQVLSLKPDTDQEVETGDWEGSTLEWLDPEEQLQTFNVHDAHCNSAADEQKIRSIIRATGTQSFNKTIREIAGKLSDSLRVDSFGVPASKLSKHVARAGYMNKRWGLHQGLQRRYFVAIDQYLYCFKDETHSRWLHAISLRGAEVAPEPIKDSLRVKFQMKESRDDDDLPERPGEWHMHCSSATDRDGWVSALRQEISQTLTPQRRLSSRSNSRLSGRTSSGGSIGVDESSIEDEESRGVGLLALGKGKAFHAFLTHDWGVDGSGRNNHARVSRINDMLKARGIVTWFDEERMEGNIQLQMCAGIDQSSVCVVFITRNYIQKVGGENMADNCKKEFEYSERRKTQEGMIPVMMEELSGEAAAYRDPSVWGGPVGMCLGGQLYVDLSGDEGDATGKFAAGVDKLAEKILCKLEAP
jgi:CRP-like cAMP-binding protein